MPLVIVVVIRVVRAFATTVRLLFDVELMRALPWPYIRRLPFRHAWIGIATAALTVSTACAIAALATSGGTGAVLAQVAWLAALAGLVSSWIRALHQRRRLRR